MAITVKVKTNPTASSYDIAIGRGLVTSPGEMSTGLAKRAVIVSNKKVFGLYGKPVADRLRKGGVEIFEHLIGDGERFKNFSTLQKTLKKFGECGLSRTDLVVALGGGVVGDLAGFAASVYLRGIPFIQIPTTLLSMIDSSVGGKTGINTDFGKNLVGSFYQPKAVLIDPDVLRTLDKREMTAGYCEAVKHGAIGGKKLLRLTEGTIESGEDFENFLAEHVKFKASIVAADEREEIGKSDARSRKILNFGHTFAHAIEKITNYRYFKHGEAVGHGIIFAAELSKKLEFLSSDEVELLNGVVHRSGRLPSLHKIDPSEVFEAFKFDKKNIGGSLQWVLLKGIGKPMIASGTDIPNTAIKEVIRKVIHT